MLNTILASIGVGAARVDTRVKTKRVLPGETIDGEIHLQGGNVDQEIEQIYMALVVPYVYETDKGDGHGTHELFSYRVAKDLVIKAGKKKVLPFQIAIPYATPETTGRQSVYLSTGLDISKAMDPKDVDPIVVVRDPLVQAVLTEASDLGFSETKDSGLCRRLQAGKPPVQEYEFKPFGRFKKELDELELHFNVRPMGVDVIAQVDRKSRGLSGMLREAMDFDELYVKGTIDRRKGYEYGSLETLIKFALDRVGR